MTGKLVSAFQAASAVPARQPGAPGLSPASGEIPAPDRPRRERQGDRRELGIAETTVRSVQHLLRKLALSSRVQAAVYATGRPGVIPTAAALLHLGYAGPPIAGISPAANVR